MNQHSVMDKHNQVISDLSMNLEKIDDCSDKILEQLEFAISYCKIALDQMRELVFLDGFPDQKSEIYYFKKLKPIVYSKLLYYLHVFEIQSNLPIADDKGLVQYYKKRIKRISEFMKVNQYEVQYFKSGFNHFDEKYFTRNKSEIPFRKMNEFYLIDEKFHTWQDHTFSEIIANHSLIEYLQNEIKKLELAKMHGHLNKKATFKWTGKMIFLIELIYGLHSTRMINDGNMEIKVIAEAMGQLFDVEIKDLYRSFQEIKQRKIDRTKFLNLMKSKLEDRMDESDL